MGWTTKIKLKHPKFEFNSIKTFEKLELLTLILRKKKQPKKSVKSSPNKKKQKKTKLQLFENIFNLYMLRGPKINFSFETPSIYIYTQNWLKCSYVPSKMAIMRTF